ncbi:MAG: phospholipase D-like domain-containing protein [Armatimonadetes bacterium]|nr:phospholipase D-like domain-containing protein [Armatimonadota bacterium]
MPRIYDNIELQFMPALEDMLRTATSADFCVGYFNLRGWNRLGQVVEDRFPGGNEGSCRLLVGMQTMGEEEVRQVYSLLREDGIDNAKAIQLRKKMAEEFRKQLTIGAPTEFDEKNLQRLANQLRTGQLVVKLFLRNSLHAKLYLVHRADIAAPIVGYVGSSNLTFAGLMKQFELNVDVVEGDASAKLAKWFEDRWADKWCLDISQELIEIIEASWARPTVIPPYHIYLNIAYHLAQEARTGLSEFKIPADFGNRLFEYQVAAVKIAAHHLNNDRRRGVILGDVVGLGKTLMATALARIFEDDLGLETLIICPKNLKPMWEEYAHRYRLRAKVVSITEVAPKTRKGADGTEERYGGLHEMRRYRLIILDESHNLRNREGSRYRAIQEYINKNESRCILLSATPYNKAYLDLGAQLRLFVPEHQDIGVRPDMLIREVGEVQFQAKHQCPLRSLAAFEKSPYADDWRELMRLYMVRRTRGFIKEHYAKTDEQNGRKHLLLENGERTYFPDRIPRTVKFEIDEKSKTDPYAKLFSLAVEREINKLNLPRYGLGNYVASKPHTPPTPAEAKVLSDLGRAGKRLMGFCRTNLFKRLESSGLAFIQSLERHILRNYIYIHAIEAGLPIPIGTSDPSMLDTDVVDIDSDDTAITGSIFDAETEDLTDSDAPSVRAPMHDPEAFNAKAKEVYDQYASKYKRRFKWLRSGLFAESLLKDLKADSDALCGILKAHGSWDASLDKKLQKLHELLTVVHPNEKVLVFTQFADTVDYLTDALKKLGVKQIEGVSGDSENPTRLAWRFSPVSNDKRELIKSDEELRVLIATDVLSEGQNLQDAHVVVNFDLPWAIIRLIQRAGRVDRIGQKHEQIYCYSFYPMDGVDRIINLRGRVRQRLTENAEVVGADEQFFEDLKVDDKYRDLYNEKSGVLDGEDDSEVDLSSHALQIWKNATDADPSLKAVIESLPDVVFSAKAHAAEPSKPHGALVYLRTADGGDALSWVDQTGKAVTESPLAILRAAACKPDTPAAPKAANHHDIVRLGVERMVEEESKIGGQLGKPSGARFRTYERLKAHGEKIKGTLFESEELLRTIEDIYRYPLRQTATDSLNRQLKAGIADESLAELCIALRSEDRLCIVEEDREHREPRIICSLGLVEVNP